MRQAVLLVENPYTRGFTTLPAQLGIMDAGRTTSAYRVARAAPSQTSFIRAVRSASVASALSRTSKVKPSSQEIRSRSAGASLRKATANHAAPSCRTSRYRRSRPDADTPRPDRSPSRSAICSLAPHFGASSQPRHLTTEPGSPRSAPRGRPATRPPHRQPVPRTAPSQVSITRLRHLARHRRTEVGKGHGADPAVALQVLPGDMQSVAVHAFPGFTLLAFRKVNGIQIGAKASLMAAVRADRTLTRY